MKQTNKAAIKALQKTSFTNAESIVNTLIEAGLLEADKTGPERLVEVAKDWLGTNGKLTPNEVFTYASGWTTDSWAFVMKESMLGKGPDIFNALVILAKEAGVEL